MTDLERRALLGDKQAQEECTRRGIVLMCPCCGCDERDMIGLSVFHEQYFYSCEACGCNGPIVYDNYDCDYPEHEALARWNTRPAPPIGRCFECKHLGERTVHETGGKENFCNHDQYGLFALDSTNAYCSYFEPKGG